MMSNCYHMSGFAVGVRFHASKKIAVTLTLLSYTFQQRRKKERKKDIKKEKKKERKKERKKNYK